MQKLRNPLSEEDLVNFEMTLLIDKERTCGYVLNNDHRITLGYKAGLPTATYWRDIDDKETGGVVETREDLINLLIKKRYNPVVKYYRKQKINNALN